jgi:hypothetical protein
MIVPRDQAGSNVASSISRVEVTKNSNRTMFLLLFFHSMSHVRAKHPGFEILIISSVTFVLSWSKEPWEEVNVEANRGI